MKQRDQVAMTDAEIAAFLAAGRKMQLATINPDGTPHLVTMYYVVMDGQITFWTYRSSQKAQNMARDPRVTCLVEAGEQYFDLRGVQVQGEIRCIADPAAVLAIGRRIVAVMAGPTDPAEPAEPIELAQSAEAEAPAGPAEAAGAEAPARPAEPARRAEPGGTTAGEDPLAEYVERAARKRLGYALQPHRVASWDHAKLASAAG